MEGERNSSNQSSEHSFASVQNFTGPLEQVSGSIVGVQGNVRVNQYNIGDSLGVKKLDKDKIKQELWRSASVIAGTVEHSVITCEKVGFGIPEITTHFQVDLDGGLHCDVPNSRYRDGNVKIDELFQRARQLATSEAAKKTTNKEASDAYIEKHGNTVAVLGQPGIGKTTFTKVFVQQILDKAIFPNVSYIFYIQIKWINFSKKCDLATHFFSWCLPSIHLTSPQKIDFLESLCNDPNVVIILEGLNEAGVEGFDIDRCNVSLLEEAFPQTFIVNLINGNLLPLAKKLVTSRPDELLELSPNFRPHFIVEVCGFSKKTQQEIGKQVCGERYEEVISKLQENEKISVYCYIPLFLLLTLSFFLETKSTRSVSLTEILSSNFENHLRSKNSCRKEAKALAKLAWWGFIENKFLFTPKYLDEARLCTSSFLFTSPTISSNLAPNISQCDKVSYFCHPLWQEYFAALFLFFFHSTEKLYEIVSSQTKNSSYATVLTFLFGFCNKQTCTKLAAVLGLNEDDLQCQKKEKILYSRFSSNVFVACRWLTESHDREISHFFLPYFPNPINMCNVTVYPQDVSCFFNIMNQLQGKVVIDRISGKFIDDAFKLFQQSLKQSTFQVVSIQHRNSSHFLSEEMIAQQRLQFFYFDHFMLTTIKVFNITKLDVLIKALKKHWSAWEKLNVKLDISGNNIGNEGLKTLASCLRIRPILLLTDCGITEIDDTFIDAIKITRLTSSPLAQPITIDLSGNKIGDRGAQKLCHIGYLTQVKCENCGISEEWHQKLLQCGTIAWCNLVSEPQERASEIQAIKSVLQRRNGYPSWLVDEKPTSAPAQPPPWSGTVVLPYLPGLTDTLQRLLQDYGIRAFIKPHCTMRSILSRPIERGHEAPKGVVYAIPCADCDRVYIGETGRALSTRVKEHRRDVEHKDAKRTALAKHAACSGHSINFDAASVLEMENDNTKRLFLETLHIHSNKKCMNDKEQCVYFPPVYNNLL